MNVPGQLTSKYSIKSIFHEVQFSKSNHPSYKKILTDVYRKGKVEDFLPEFLQCLKVCLMHEEKSDNVERTLDFAANFAVSFSVHIEDDDETCPLLEGVFQFIFDNHDCHVQLVRLRICQLMNRLLDDMGYDGSVVEETYNKIAESMLVRLQDSMTSVRTQAVYALHRLQSPNDPKCEIIRAFVYHMTHDPCHEVRRAVIQKIAVNKMTLSSILTRMNDVKDSVRKEAYVIISKFLIRQFTIKQRQLILETGLGDRSEAAREYVIGTLVPSWLKYFNYNYYDFLDCIHVEKIPETGLKLLKAIFAKQQVIILESRVKEMWIINQKIAYDKLNIITVVYWRALAEFVKPEDDDDKFEHIFEQVLPDLTPFCNYIREYFFPPVDDDQSNDSSKSSSLNERVSNKPESSQESSAELAEQTETADEKNKNISNTLPVESKEDNTNKPETNKTGSKRKPDEAVLVHLLEMCKVYDLSDEMGRTSLKQLCVDFLQSPDVTLQSIPVLASLLDHTIPSVGTKLSVMAEIITELREPLQSNDHSVYVPDVLLLEAEEKKTELGERLVELTTEMEIAKEIGDGVRVEEIERLKGNLEEELKIMNAVTPHEPGRNMNNDPETLKKCLTIVVEIMKTGKITKMNPTLYSLMQNFIITTLKLKVEGDGSTIIKNLALQALGIFCVLDIELAKEHFMMFCFNIANETMSVTALKCVFDLLHVYGLSTFNIEDPEEIMKESSEDDGSRKPNLVVLLMSLLTSESPEMKKTAVIGLCKLLFAGRIKSPELVTKLIMLWFNPIVENDPHIRQPLGVFFRMFASRCPHAPELLMKAFIPTIKEFFKLEVSDPMMEVEIDSVANLMVDLTRPSITTHTKKELSVHNQIAIQICEEVLSEELDSSNCIFLVKNLSHLELDFDLTTDIAILSALVYRMVKAVQKEDKNLYRLAVKFETMLNMRLENNKTVSTVDNTLPAEASFKSNSTGRSSQLLLTRDDFESESEEVGEEDEEELSQDDTFTRVNNTEDMVIPGTPETSDSEDSDDFKGFDPPILKSARLSDEATFKRPSAAAPRTPAKTPFKVPKRTPRKTASKTPAKVSFLSLPQISKEILESSLVQVLEKTPSKSTSSSAKTPAKTPKTAEKSSTKTPAKASNTSPKSAVKTPAKITRSAMKTPSKTRTATPEKTCTDEIPTSERKTRSSRKRKL